MVWTRLGLFGGAVALGGGLWLTAGPQARASLAPAGAAQPEAGGDPAALELERRYRERVLPVMEQFCFRCHGASEAKSGVRFEGAASVVDFMAIADDLEAALDLVALGDMPPEDEPRPTDAEREVLTSWLEDVLAYTPPVEEIDPGWFTIHRLNKAEYRNTVRDLLGVDPAEVDLAADLPPDDTGYGFDNIADVLTMSPLQLELYLAAAERAVEIGLGPEAEIGGEPMALREVQATSGQRLGGGGGYLTSSGEVFGTAEAPLTGEYEIVVEAWGDRGGDELPRMSVRVDGREVAAHFVEAERGDVQVFRVPVRLDAGTRRIGAAFTNDYWVPNVADRNLAVESLALAGPVSAEGLERPAAYGEVFFVTPGEGAGVDAQRVVARKVIGRFAERAFRRPLEPEQFRRLMRLYEASRDAGDTHERAVRTVLAATLVSPNFLYRSVRNPAPEDAGAVYWLDGYELASRLSYFLWSSTPDEELLELAGAGLLTDEFVLRMQALRMLEDPRADAFIENFAGQWLQLRNLERVAIDPGRFPEYTPALREDMRREALLFFADVVRSERSVVDLIGGRETFLNERLAAHYGVEGVEGEGFRRVALGEDSARGGVLTMGAVLTVTSNPTRTSPVKRGLYVLDQMLGAPPPPPPPDIPRLEQSARDLPEDAPVREKLAAHLTDSACVTCHRRMDPIGLAMENFDAIGRWRDSEHGREIDASGVLPGGVRFDGPRELREILLAQRGDFVENLARQVLIYALGRGLEPFDRPAVRLITEEAGSRGETFASLIEAVVASPAFRSCRGRGEVGVADPGDGGEEAMR